MRAVVILVLVGGICGCIGCNSEATVCPQPGVCDNGGQDTASDATPEVDAAGETPTTDAGSDADAD